MLAASVYPEQANNVTFFPECWLRQPCNLLVTDQDFESAVFLVALRLHLGMDGEELTEQETALYDRQIRVWGTDAQRRLLFYALSFCI